MTAPFFYLCSILFSMIKKLIIIVLLFIISNQAIASVISPELELEMRYNISKIYGEENTDEIYKNIENLAKKAKIQRPRTLIQEDLTRSSDWYKDEIIYMFYIDQFGTDNQKKSNTFKDGIKMLDYLKDLGITTIYILPFADSPMGDSGFDVKNPNNVRQDLGGMKEFREFVKVAREKGFKIKADLILNHFSDQHEWFQEALKGDLDKLNYFIVREDMPEYTKYVDKKKGTIIEYKEPDGKISKRRLIFPEITENHYRKITINNKDYYIYHTFYPFQLDINWENPKVLYYCLDSISYWANIGIDIFRMDAIPYFSKEEGTDAENLDTTHYIVKLLSQYIQATAPRSVLQAEACQKPKDILPYFGEEREVNTYIDNRIKRINRTDEIQIAYHFPYMPALWAMFITEDNKYFIDANKHTPQIPETASWATFLRVHDELTLEMINPDDRELIYNALEPKGCEFRKGLGVSGRTANFLDNNPDRITLAFSTLLSMPGIPIIYYGDEIAAQNNFEYADNYAEKRKKQLKKNKIKLLTFFDSRDINRGDITYQSFMDSMKKKNTLSSKVRFKIKQMIKLRKMNPTIARGSFEIIKTKLPSTFAYIRTYKDTKFLIVHNLSKEKQKVEISLPSEIIEKDNDGYVNFKNLLDNKKYKVKISLTDKKIHLLMQPYSTMWLKIITNKKGEV